MKISLFKAVNANRIMCRTLKAAAVCMPMLLSSCVYEDALQKAECGSTDQLTLQLNLTLPAASQGTRAGNHGSDPGSEAENYIDVKGGDYRVLVYDADNGDYITEVSMLEFSKLADTGSEVIYSLLGDIDLRNEPDKKLENFRVMILANWNAYDNDRSYGDYDFTGKESDIYADKENYNFTNPATSTAAWVPGTEGASPRLIPMFGVSKDISVSQAVEGYIFYNDLYGSIPMLRSIAKVEIVDNLPESSKITDVTLSKSSAKGRFIPAILESGNASWGTPSTQVTVPSLPQYGAGDTKEYENVPFFNTGTKFIIDDEEKDVWAAYIPEMNVASALRQDLDKKRPEILIGTTAKSEKENFFFDNYVDGKKAEANQLQYVLRNHIYRYIVTGETANLELSLQVLPWDMKWDENPTNFDTPHASGYLSWQARTYTSEDAGTDPEGDEADSGVSGPENGYVDMAYVSRLIMKAGTESFVEGTFTLDSPMNGTWVAYLKTSSGANDAFYFTDGTPIYETDASGNQVLDEDGQPIFVQFKEAGNSGVIDGSPITIKIANRRTSVADVPNEATLIIMVQYPDKTQKEVYVVDPNSPSGKTNYTIVQVITEIM